MALLSSVRRLSSEPWYVDLNHRGRPRSGESRRRRGSVKVGQVAVGARRQDADAASAGPTSGRCRVACRRAAGGAEERSTVWVSGKAGPPSPLELVRLDLEGIPSSADADALSARAVPLADPGRRTAGAEPGLIEPWFQRTPVRLSASGDPPALSGARQKSPGALTVHATHIDLESLLCLASL